jgi:hypothetical protein
MRMRMGTGVQKPCPSAGRDGTRGGVPDAPAAAVPWGAVSSSSNGVLQRKHPTPRTDTWLARPSRRREALGRRVVAPMCRPAWPAGVAAALDRRNPALPTHACAPPSTDTGGRRLVEEPKGSFLRLPHKSWIAKEPTKGLQQSRPTWLDRQSRAHGNGAGRTPRARSGRDGAPRRARGREARGGSMGSFGRGGSRTAPRGKRVAWERLRKAGGG